MANLRQANWQAVTMALMHGQFAVLRGKWDEEDRQDNTSLAAYETAGSLTLFQTIDEAVAHARREVEFLSSPAVQTALAEIDDASDRYDDEAWNILEEIDSPHRLSDVVIVARIAGASHQTWRRSNAVGTTVQTAGWRTSSGPTVAAVDPSTRPRPALLAEAREFAAELATRLRRQMER